MSNFWKQTAEARDVESLVRAHVTPFCSIHDIADTLASNILPKFPAAFKILLGFQPDIRNVYKTEGLMTAACSLHKLSTPMKCTLDEHNDFYEIKTEWQLPISLPSGYAVLFALRTVERCASTVHDQISSLENSPFRPRFNRVHPTFGLHEQVASIAAEELKNGSVEGAALYVARSLFFLADKQSPCKRIQRVTITMRNMIPFSEGIQFKAAKITEERQRENVNNVFTICSLRLDRRHYEQSQCSLQSKDFQSGRHRAFIALGSNLGKRVEMIEWALREMGNRGLSVSRTSALYETKPMYLENQQSFINGACEVCSTKQVIVEGDVDVVRLKHL